MKIVIDIPDDEYKFIKDLQSLVIGGRGNCRTIQRDVINAIKKGTPYEERPKGKWIEHSTYKGVLICSHCNHGETQAYDTFKFCPYCGADMRGDV